MKLDIKNNVEHPVLGRKEVKGTLQFEQATPSRLDVRKQIASQLSSDEKLVVVKNVNSSFGQRQATFTAHIYSSKEKLDKLAGVAAQTRQLTKDERKAMKEKKNG